MHKRKEFYCKADTVRAGIILIADILNDLTMAKLQQALDCAFADDSGPDAKARADPCCVGFDATCCQVIVIKRTWDETRHNMLIPLCVKHDALLVLAKPCPQLTRA
jgi:hypothetical protein